MSRSNAGSYAEKAMKTNAGLILFLGIGFGGGRGAPNR
jgi:hypothetical protein